MDRILAPSERAAVVELGQVVELQDEFLIVRDELEARSEPEPSALSSSVAGESNRSWGTGTGGSDWPGTPIPPAREMLARGSPPRSTAPGVGTTAGSDGGSPDPSTAPAVGTPGWAGA
jgi:hypothetical protein